MILFSSILLQEAKELESIKDFLLACNDKAQIELFNLKDKLEDMQMEISTEKKVNFIEILFVIGVGVEAERVFVWKKQGFREKNS